MSLTDRPCAQRRRVQSKPPSVKGLAESVPCPGQKCVPCTLTGGGLELWIGPFRRRRCAQGLLEKTLYIGYAFFVNAYRESSQIGLSRSLISRKSARVIARAHACVSTKQSSTSICLQTRRSRDAPPPTSNSRRGGGATRRTDIACPCARAVEASSARHPPVPA